MKEILSNALLSLQGAREKAFFRVMWYIVTVLVVIWSILMGIQMVLNCSIIDHNSQLVSKSDKAVGIESVEDEYLILSNKEKVKESEITEYVKTKTGMSARYLGEGTATQPISVSETIGYSIPFIALVISAFVCLAFCNLIGSVLARWKRVMLRICYVLLLVLYLLEFLVYSGMFTYVESEWYMFPVLVSGFSVILIFFNVSLFSIRLEKGEGSRDVNKK